MRKESIVNALSGYVKREFTAVQRPEGFMPPDVEFVYDPESDNYYLEDYPQGKLVQDLGAASLRHTA